jgi:hypothetical protein
MAHDPVIGGSDTILANEKFLKTKKIWMLLSYYAA